MSLFIIVMMIMMIMMMQLTVVNTKTYLFRKKKNDFMPIIIKSVELETVGIKEGKINYCYFNNKWHVA